MSSIPFSYYLYQSLKRYGVLFAGKQIERCLSLFYIWAAFCLRKNRSPAPIFFPFLHHRRQVFPLHCKAFLLFFFCKTSTDGRGSAQQRVWHLVKLVIRCCTRMYSTWEGISASARAATSSVVLPCTTFNCKFRFNILKSPLLEMWNYVLILGAE